MRCWKKMMVLLVVGSWLGLLLPQAGLAQYLGEVIWTATILEKETGPVTPPITATGRIGITLVGGNYYSVQGYVEAPDPMTFSGGGVLIGDTLYLTCASSQRHSSESWRDAGTIHIELNRNTLSGELYDIGRDFNTETRQFMDRYTRGTLTRTGGLSTLITGKTSANMLLLQEK